MSKSILNNKLALEKAANSSGSIKEALEYLGLRAAGSNYKQFHKYCKKYNIQVPKVSKYQQTRKAIEASTIPLEEILVSNSSYTNRRKIKDRCYEAGLLKEVCYICGIEPKWNNETLALQLDHINGVYNDNRLENLRILCPNCHSQTKTFAGKYKKQTKNYCKDCYKPIYKNSLRCIICSNKAKDLPTKIDWPSNEKLKQMLEESSYSAVAKVLGVSDNAVRKRLKNHP